MKIATNVSRDAFGGITISNLALFDWLENKEDTLVGFEVVTQRRFLGPVIFRRYHPDFFRHVIVNGIDIMPKRPWEGFGDLRRKWSVLIDEVKAGLAQERPDVVLINGTYNVSWILAIAAKELGLPVVLRYAGVLSREVSHRGWLTRRRLLVYERQIAEIADAVIYPSTLCREVVEHEVLGHSAAQAEVIPNPATARMPRARRRSGRYTIAAVGRWSAIKNFQAFISAHNTLLNQHWTHRALMLTSHWDERFGIPETIERRDPMAPSAMPAFYRSIDLLVVPSHFETFCNVAAEAVLNGTCVLVSEKVGFAEVLRKAGLSRMIIPTFDDPMAVAAAIRKLSRYKLGVRERAKVASLLNPHTVHKAILDVMHDVLHDQRS